jgi:VanZ family protein
MRIKILFWCWLTGLTVASLLPGDSLPDQTFLFPGADKLIHVFMYAGLAICANLAFGSKSKKRSIHLLFGLVAYGLLLEVLQPTLSSRTFEWMDLAANSLGTALGLSSNFPVFLTICTRDKGERLRGKIRGAEEKP